MPFTSTMPINLFAEFGKKIRKLTPMLSFVTTTTFICLRYITKLFAKPLYILSRKLGMNLVTQNLNTIQPPLPLSLGLSLPKMKILIESDCIVNFKKASSSPSTDFIVFYFLLLLCLPRPRDAGEPSTQRLPALPSSNTFARHLTPYTTDSLAIQFIIFLST